MAEVRLIAADALVEYFDYLACSLANARCFSAADAIKGASEKVASAPTIDAVPVVRCKDCKHRGSPYNCPMRNLVMPFSGSGSYADYTEDDGYCHMGVKKDGGVDDA